MRTRNDQVFYIWSPRYTHLHSGVRCLHLLCHHLNRLGYEAYITGRNAPPHLLTRHAKQRVIDKNRQAGIDDIVIYPELVAGNPLGGKKVVRYLLNKPGALNRVTPSDYGAEDYIIHFANEFQHEQLTSRLLTIPTLDQAIFHRKSEVRGRRGYVLYSVRYKPDLGKIPGWVSPYVVISPEEPRDPETLAELYQRSKALVVWERTAAIGEAMRCGCPVIMIPRDGFEYRSIVRACLGSGLVIGWRKAWLPFAQRTVGIATGLYRMRSIGLDRAIHKFVHEARRHFARRDES